MKLRAPGMYTWLTYGLVYYKRRSATGLGHPRSAGARDVVAQSSKQGTILLLVLAVGLWVICGCRDMLDDQAGYSMLEIT